MDIMDVRTEDNCRIGDPKVMTSTKGAPTFAVSPLVVNGHPLTASHFDAYD